MATTTKSITFFLPADSTTAVTLKTVKIDDEYVVKWIENGVYNEEKSYFTSDREDALSTMHAMCSIARGVA